MASSSDYQTITSQQASAEQNNAAATIQARYRGHRARLERTQRQHQQSERQLAQWRRQNAAAWIIQKAFISFNKKRKRKQRKEAKKKQKELRRQQQQLELDQQDDQLHQTQYSVTSTTTTTPIDTPMDSKKEKSVKVIASSDKERSHRSKSKSTSSKKKSRHSKDPTLSSSKRKKKSSKRDLDTTDGSDDTISSDYGSNYNPQQVTYSTYPQSPQVGVNMITSTPSMQPQMVMQPTFVPQQGQMFMVSANGELHPVNNANTVNTTSVNNTNTQQSTGDSNDNTGTSGDNKKSSSGSTTTTNTDSSNMTLMHSVLNGAVMQKKDRLQRQVTLIERRIQEVQMYRKSIETETRADMEAIISRLTFAENSKLSVLNRDLDELKADIAFIDEFEKQLMEEESPNMANFLQRFEEIKVTCNRIIEKPFKAMLDVVPDDFPTENQDRIDIIRSHNQLVALLHFKDQMVWSLLQENRQLKDQIQKDHQLHQSQSNQWQSLVNRYESAIHQSNNDAGSTTTNDSNAQDASSTISPSVSSVSLDSTTASNTLKNTSTSSTGFNDTSSSLKSTISLDPVISSTSPASVSFHPSGSDHGFRHGSTSQF